MYSNSSKTVITITSKFLQNNLLKSANRATLKKYITNSSIIILQYDQKSNFHSTKQKNKLKLESEIHNNSSSNNNSSKFKNNNKIICYSVLGSKRNYSSSTENAFRRFRSFANGEQFTKRFLNSVLQYSASVSYSPKDRLKNNSVSPDDGIYDTDDDDDDANDNLNNISNSDNSKGEFVQNFKLLNAKNVYESPTGEDNYILAYTDIGIIIGVLDGVGGWSEQGFDSSAISRELANKITDIYLNNPNLNPNEILNKAYNIVKNEGIVKVGSTTICFGIIDGNSGNLNAVNLGDSWFGIFRKDDHFLKYKCVKQSTEQIYYFNAPYQLSIIPEEILNDAKKRGSKYLMNQPDEADNYNFNLKSGDIIIFSTDGLVDNVITDDIELYLNDNIKDGVNLAEHLGELNKLLVKKTTILSLNTNFKSNFSQKLTEITGQDYIGGKPDDITSVMVYVK